MRLKWDLEGVVQRILRTTYLLTVAILIALDVIALRYRFLPQWATYVFVGIAAIPTVFFGVALFVVSSRGVYLKAEAGWWPKSLASVAFIMLPAFYVTFRYSLWSVEIDQSVVWWVVVAHCVAAVSVPFPLLDIAGSQSGLLEIQRFMKRVMWDPAPDFWYGRGRVPTRAVWRERRGMYQDRASLAVFQKSFISYASDACAVAEMLAAAGLKRGELNVLDVGAGDGRFSGELFRVLERTGRSVRSVCAVDPIDFIDEYSVRTGLERQAITWVPRRFQETRISDKFDVVLGIHSLYEAIDSAAKELSCCQTVVDWLCDKRSPDGHCAIVLASSLSRSSEFKERAIAYAFGTGTKDVTGEDLLLLPALETARFRRTDSLIDLEDLLELAQAGAPSELNRWLSYFLRYQVARDGTCAAVLRGWLTDMVQPASSLPEGSFGSQLEATIGTQSEHRVLQHKSCVWVV